MAMGWILSNVILSSIDRQIRCVLHATFWGPLVDVLFLGGCVCLDGSMRILKKGPLFPRIQIYHRQTSYISFHFLFFSHVEMCIYICMIWNHFGGHCVFITVKINDLMTRGVLLLTKVWRPYSVTQNPELLFPQPWPVSCTNSDFITVSVC